MTVEKPTKIVNTTLYWPGERCDRCKRRVVVGYNIADKDWAAVTKDTNYTTLCLACFDELAQMKGVRYQTQTHNLHSVLWHDWYNSKPEDIKPTDIDYKIARAVYRSCNRGIVDIMKYTWKLIDRCIRVGLIEISGIHPITYRVVPSKLEEVLTHTYVDNDGVIKSVFK